MKKKLFLTLIIALVVFLLSSCQNSEEKNDIYEALKHFETQTSYKVLYSSNKGGDNVRLYIEKDDNIVKIVQGNVINFEEHLENGYNSYVSVLGFYCKAETEYDESKSLDITRLLADFSFSKEKYILNDNGYFIVENPSKKTRGLQIKIVDNRVFEMKFEVPEENESYYEVIYNFSKYGEVKLSLPENIVGTCSKA